MDRLLTRLRFFYRSNKTRINVLSLMALAVGISSLVAAPLVLASDEDTAARVITVHDQGTDIGILTSEDTLREIFAANGIQINPHDHVEPGLDYQLDAETYDVNIYRARPITVIDGKKYYRIVTSYQTPEQIAEVAGLKLYDADRASLRAPVDLLTEGSGLVLQIERATPINVDLFGKDLVMRTMADTVQGFLDEKGIKLADNEKASLPLDTKIRQGMDLALWRNGKQTVTRTESIDFEVQKIRDADKPIGYHKIKQKGAKGEKEVTYTVVMRNGVERQRKEIHSVTTKEPVKQVEVVGTKYDLPPGSHQDWMAAAGIAEEDFGYVNYIVNNENASWHPCRVQGAGMIIDCTYAGTANRGYGLVQATPGSKMSSAGSDWQTNPVTQLKWADSYAVGRYDSWQDAYEFKVANGWW